MGGLVVVTLHFAGKNARNSLQILDLQKLSSQFPLSCSRVNSIPAIYFYRRDIFILRVPGFFVRGPIISEDVRRSSEDVLKGLNKTFSY